jgi:hypothetical protein
VEVVVLVLVLVVKLVCVMQVYQISLFVPRATDEWPISISNPALSSSGDPFGSQGFNEGQIRKMLKGVAGEPIVVKDIAPTTTHAKAE